MKLNMKRTTEIPEQEQQSVEKIGEIIVTIYLSFGRIMTNVAEDLFSCGRKTRMKIYKNRLERKNVEMHAVSLRKKSMRVRIHHYDITE